MEYLRPYQSAVETQVYQAWAEGAKILMPVVPTGGGKTRTVGKILGDERHHATVALSHRQELVGQWSNSLASYGVPHAVIAPPGIIRDLHREQTEVYGRSFIDQNARHCVAGVEKWLSLGRNHTRVARTKKWAVDEGHHLQQGNKWGRAVEMMPDSLGLAPTATPMRSDGHALGRKDGYVDRLIIGPNARDLTAMGYLTDWDIVCPEETVDISNVDHGSNGDFVQAQLRDAVHKARGFVGSIVDSYRQYCPGKLAMVFAVDVESANDIASAFRAAGISAVSLNGKTDAGVRRDAIRRFRSRDIRVIVNVDLFGEGTDVPALEVVIMARHTDSFGLYDQQSGRVKRLMIERSIAARWDDYTNAQRLEFIAQSVKPIGLIIDHVGNFGRFGPSDRPRVWTLERQDRKARSQSDAIPTRRCTNPNRGDGVPCAKPYERIRLKCPHCGFAWVPAERAEPAQVEGVMSLLGAEAIEAFRRAMAAADRPPEVYGLPQIAQMSQRKIHHARMEARDRLRDMMAWWGGRCTTQGLDQQEAQAMFYHRFGIDVWSAQCLTATESEALAARIAARIAIDGFVINA